MIYLEDSITGKKFTDGIPVAAYPKVNIVQCPNVVWISYDLNTNYYFIGTFAVRSYSGNIIEDFSFSSAKAVVYYI